MRKIVGALTALLLAAFASAPARASDVGEAAYKFALAKFLSEQGRLLEALALFPDAVAATPDDPYLRIEYAELLLRVAQRFSAGPGRLERLSEAAEQAAVARRLSPQNVEALKALGQVNLSLSEYRGDSLDAAIEAFEGIRRQAPWDLQSMVTLAQVYRQQQKTEEAAQVLQEASAHAPDNRIVYSLLGEALLAGGRDAEAEPVLRRQLDLDPRALDSRVQLARLLSRRGDHRAAAATLKAAPEDIRGERQLQDELVWQLYQAEELDEALAGVEAILATDAEGTWPRFVHAMVLAGLGRNDEALAGLEALRAADPDNLDLARTAAGLLERDGRPEEAERVLTELVAALAALPGEAGDEVRARARFLLAGVQFRAGRREAARASLEPLLAAADPEVRSEAVVTYAELLFDSGRRREALDLVDRHAASAPVVAAKQVELLLRAGEERKARRIVQRLARDGAAAETLFQVAQVAQRQGAYELSLAPLERLLDDGATRREIFFLAGAAYERTGAVDRSIATLRRLLDSEPDYAPALNYLGYLWADRGENLEEALRLTRRAVELSPDSGAYVDSLGWALFRLGRHDEARVQLERAAELLPDDATVCEHLADLHAAVGETDRAVALYRRALDLEAEDAEAVRRKLDRLRSP